MLLLFFFAEEYAKVISVIFAYPGEVDRKAYIIAVLDPEKKSDVHAPCHQELALATLL
jgi:hypothetical protein